MWISYSSGLAQDNSWDCRAIYQSDTYLSVFPRRLEQKDDQNTKQHRENKKHDDNTMLADLLELLQINDVI